MKVFLGLFKYGLLYKGGLLVVLGGKEFLFMNFMVLIMWFSGIYILRLFVFIIVFRGGI